MQRMGKSIALAMIMASGSLMASPRVNRSDDDDWRDDEQIRRTRDDAMILDELGDINEPYQPREAPAPKVHTQSRAAARRLRQIAARKAPAA